MGHLTLSMFGTFEAVLGGQPIIHFRSSKVQGLLIYLVMTSAQAHSREALAALFWPEESEKTAKHNLRQSLFRLRKLLDETNATTPFLLVNRSSVQFNSVSDISSDVTTFLTHIENNRPDLAIPLYRGDLLSGLSCDSLPFDDWLRQEREQLHRHALNALFILADQRLQQGDFANAQRFAQQQLTWEPWREEAHRQLIQALALAGERSAALAQYEQCQAILAEELGVEPAAETKRLISYIQNSATLSTSQTKKRQANGRKQLTIPFAGRQAEYEALTIAYQRIENDGAQLVTVSGKAGIGKTRLVEQFLTWVTMQGADLLYGRSFETSTGLSYQPLVQLMRLRLERENAPEDLLSDFWLSQLTRLLPELRDRYPDLPLPTQDEATAKPHLFEAITRLGQALAERQPLVLFVDDWHWADSASLDLLHYATLRWAEAKLPILLLLTLRQEAVPTETESWITRLTETVPTTALYLNELSQDETTGMLQKLLGIEMQAADDSELAQFGEWLFAETEGQPLFLAETLKALVNDGLLHPTTSKVGWQIDWVKLNQQGVRKRALSGVQAVIRGWLNRIGDVARGVLTAVSVLEQEASFDHLRHVADLEELQVIDALDELLSKQLLLEGQTTLSTSGLETIYRFSHQKISAVVYAEAGTARQRMLYRRAFTSLQAATAPAAESAYHAQRAGLAAETVHYSLKAGDEAMVAFATRVALTHYETAWEISNQNGGVEPLPHNDRESLFLGLGRSYELLDEWEKAKDIYEAMLSYAQERHASIMECKSLNLLAIMYAKGLQGSQHAMTLLEQARAVAEQSGNQLGLLETELNLAMAARMTESIYQVIHLSENALAMARELNDSQLLARCLIENAYPSFLLRRWKNLETYWNEAYDIFFANGNLIWAEKCRAGTTFAQLINGRVQESLPILQASYAFTQQIESLWEETEVGRSLALAHLELGEYGEAVNLIQHVEVLTRKAPIPTVKKMTAIYSGIIHRTVMSLEGVKTSLADFLDTLLPEGMPNITDWYASELCAVHALDNEWGDAYRYAKLALDLRNEALFPAISFAGWFETEALLRGGDVDLARTEVGRLEALEPPKRYRLPLLRSWAVLAQWDGEVAQAIEHLEEALTLAQEMGLPGEEWPILGELGKLYAAQGETERGQAAYGQAAVIIRRLADTIEDMELREGFVTAVSIRSILALSIRK